MRRVVREGQVPTFKCDLGDGDWVELKTRFTLADREAINEAIVSGQITSTADGGMGLGKLSLGASNTATLLRGIISWGGPGFCSLEHEVAETPDGFTTKPIHDVDSKDTKCKTLNVTTENIRGLDDGTARFLLAEMEVRNIETNPLSRTKPTSEK